MSFMWPNRERPAENLLIGAALRAANRLSQGVVIEADKSIDYAALSLLRRAMGDEEIAVYGQLFAQFSQNERKEFGIGRNEAWTPYTREDYIRDAISQAPEILAYPGNRVAALDEIKDCLQPGVVLYTAPEDREPPPVEGGATVLGLESMGRVQVRTQSTGLSWPRQVCLALQCETEENVTTTTHWRVAAGTELDRLRKYKSITSSSHLPDTVRIEQRASERGLELHLEVLSNGQEKEDEEDWAASLREALSEFFWDSVQGVSDHPEATIALLAQTNSFFRFTCGLRNQNSSGPLARWTTIFLTSSALNWLWGRPIHEVCLSRTNHSRLYLDREPVATPNKEATIKCYSRNPDDGVWTAGPEGPIPSYQGMPMVRFRGEMFGLLANPLDKQLCSTRWNKDTLSWETPRPMDGHQTTTQIAGAVINETFYVAFRDLTGDICVISTTDLGSWTPVQKLGQVKTNFSPAIGFNGRGLLAAYCGTDNQIYTTSNNPDGSWNEWTPVSGARSLAGPTLMWFDGAMNLIYIGEKDNRVRFQRYPPGSAEWSAPFVLAAARTSATCKVASFGTYLMMGIRGLDEQGTIQLITYTPGKYSVQRLDGCHSIGPLGLCNWDGKLWLTYSDMDS